jgi:hypothetical protein
MMPPKQRLSCTPTAAGPKPAASKGAAAGAAASPPQPNAAQQLPAPAKDADARDDGGMVPDDQVEVEPEELAVFEQVAAMERDKQLAQEQQVRVGVCGCGEGG